jgi:hypothetical protein
VARGRRGRRARGTRTQQRQRQERRSGTDSQAPSHRDDETRCREDRQLVHAEQASGERRRSDDAKKRRLDGCLAEPPQRLDDHRDDHGLDPAHHALDLGERAVLDIHPRDRADDRDGRQDEARARDQQTRQTSTGVPDVDRQLGRVRARDQVRRAEQVEEVLARHPLSPSHDLVLHHRDVRRRPTERDEAELAEQARELAQRRRLRRRGFHLGMRHGVSLARSATPNASSSFATSATERSKP